MSDISLYNYKLGFEWRGIVEILDFFHPQTIDDVKLTLSKYSNCKLLAGGTDLVINLSRGEEIPEYLIDLGKVDALAEIIEKDDCIELGSMVTFSQMRENKVIKDNYKALIECAENMGSPQIRNAATIGGNIANAGSAADAVPCFISLHGKLVIENIEGQRIISCEEYFKNYNTHKLKENEIITKIILPKEGKISGFYKLGKRNSLAIARVCAAVSLQLENKIVKDISICLGAVGRHPLRAYEVEQMVLGKDVEYLYKEEVLNCLEAAVYESIKGRKTMPFKKEAIKGVYKQALNSALGIF